MHEPRSAALAAGLLAAFLAAAGPAKGQSIAVDLELVLAVDVSMSMDHDEQKLQRDGYVAALRHPEVHAAITGNAHGRIAVIYVEWAGVDIHRIVAPWTVIDGPDSAEAFARVIEGAPIRPARRTSIASVLSFAADLFGSGGVEGVRRIIDVSGDGANNQGEPVHMVRDRVVARNITINGLPIMLKAGGYSTFFDMPDLDDYYEDCVIGGFGAFIVPVTKTDEFAIAIRRKLVLEIAAPAPRARVMRAQLLQRDPTDCFAGEKQWRRWMLDAN